MDFDDIPSNTLEPVAMMEGILIASATGDSPDNHIYGHLRGEFMNDPIDRR